MQKLAGVILVISFFANQIGLAQEQPKLQSAKSQNQQRLGIVADPGDEFWFAMSGMNSLNYALTVDNSGNLYAGGQFTTAGGTNAKYVAKWDGSNWSALGSGISFWVYALEVDGSGNLYAGCLFSTAGGTNANNIAKWNGATWSVLGSGVGSFFGGRVLAMACDGSGNLYVGGNFSAAGGNNANNIAKWNGESWSALGSGVNDDVLALAIDSSGNLYAGGQFKTAGGTNANHVAKWDGNSWSALGSGTADYVFTLAAAGGGNVYAGGFFQSAGGDTTITGIAKWSGTSWSALSGGVDGGVKALTLDGSGNLFVGGRFNAAGGSSANNIAKWDGSNWSALGSGVDNEVLALADDGSGNLFVGGRFTTAGGKSSNYIARWVDPGAVPVELTSFSASVAENFIKLGWNTATETNNFGFDIERSADGSDFNKIGFVGGRGTTTISQSYQFVDKDIAVGVNYYRLKQIDLDGAFEYSHVLEVAVGGPKKFDLAQNYPNPFNPSTQIGYDLPEQANVRLQIFNMLGQKVRTLVDQEQTAGTKTVRWDATDDFGNQVVAGTYVVRLQVKTGTSSRVFTKKMTLLK